MSRLQWSRPISQAERGPAFALASAVLVVLSAAVLLVHPHAHRSTSTESTAATRLADPRPAAVADGPSRAVLLADARQFADGLLAYLYEGADAQTVPRVSFALRRTLARTQARPVRSHRRRVRLLDVQILAVASTSARVLLTAVDESGATFAIRVRLTRHAVGGWEASGLDH